MKFKYKNTVDNILNRVELCLEIYSLSFFGLLSPLLAKFQGDVSDPFNVEEVYKLSLTGAENVHIRQAPHLPQHLPFPKN